MKALFGRDTGISKDEIAAAIRAEQEARWAHGDALLAAQQRGEQVSIHNAWPARRTVAQLRADLFRIATAANTAE